MALPCAALDDRAEPVEPELLARRSFVESSRYRPEGERERDEAVGIGTLARVQEELAAGAEATARL
jgi:hypothetical protein